MSQDILDSLRAEGSRVSAGGFSLDREKAREKLANYQLVDPHHYVLELVQAASILGASYIDIEIDTDEMTMTFDGLSLTRAELENLYRASFASADTPKLRALRHLAIGVTAAWALDPARIVIDVYDGESKVQAILDRDGDDDISVQPLETSPQTRIYLVKRVSPGLLADFVRYIQGRLAEQVALREYCASADIPILLNGDSISHGHRLRERAKAVVPIETPHETGRVGVTMEYRLAPAHIQILTNGVLVSEIQGSDEPFGYDAIVDSSRLEKGLSQGDIVRNDTWSEVRHDIIETAVYRSLTIFVRGLDAVSAATHATALRRIAVWLWGPPNDHDSESLRAAHRAARRALRTASIWPYASRAASEASPHARDALVSIDEIVEQTASNTINISTIEVPDSASGDVPTAILIQPAQRAIFEDTVGARLRDITDEIERAGRRRRRIDEFAQRGPPSQPNPDYFLAHRLIETGSFRAFVGVRVGSARAVGTSRVEWTNTELILHERMCGVDLGQLFIWFHGPLPFRMEPPYFEPTPGYADVALQVLETIPDLVVEVIGRLSPRSAIDLLLTLTSRARAMRLADDLELQRDQFTTLLRRLADDAVTPRWYDFEAMSLTRSDEAIAQRVRELGPLAQVDVIELGLERRVSLQTLLEIYHEHGELRRGHDIYPQMSGPLAVTGGSRDIELVERIFGFLAKPETDDEDPMFSTMTSVHAQTDRAEQAPSGAQRSQAPTPTDSQRFEIDPPSKPTPTSTPRPRDHAEPAPPFQAALQQRFDRQSETITARIVEIEDRPGSPAALLEPDRCVVNAAHPIIEAAVAHPDSERHQQWAETAALTAIAAGGTVVEREFAFGQLVAELQAN